MSNEHLKSLIAPTKPASLVAAHETCRGCTVKEAAEILGCCERTVRNEIDNGTMPFYRVGKRGIRIPWDVLEKRVTGCCSGSGSIPGRSFPNTPGWLSKRK